MELRPRRCSPGSRGCAGLCRKIFLRPSGAGFIHTATHSLRCGLYSWAAARLYLAIAFHFSRGLGVATQTAVALGRPAEQSSVPQHARALTKKGCAKAQPLSGNKLLLEPSSAATTTAARTASAATRSE